MICEGSMHLHNFPVDYRDANDVDYKFETGVFRNNSRDNGLTAEAICNDNRRLRIGRRSTSDDISLRQGLQIRDGLRQAIFYHDMIRPRL